MSGTKLLRASPSKSSLTAGIGEPPLRTGLTDCACKSTDVAVPEALMKSGSTLMLTESLPVAVLHAARVVLSMPLKIPSTPPVPLTK